MSGMAIMMMLLFIVVIWGGFAFSLTSLMKHPDETSGQLGDAEYATDEVLIAQEEAK
ncbi:methionine/alanine import NSS transporter subunit MetS [Corynebacterium sp. 153RC1]|uniref:methionine/alanine import NSS transporter subunit MetS n=1 Tax=Corynebacterium TaxID=1716 RepID=UPI00211B8F0C|nr:MULTISPECIES: methionine/alanine import NSS transporter subunit MetS [unclassified Corynebacterium]MCQ9370390.1 methionine/alanine import NSS transporter subunit MetS [Corynebacterium sp. 35RC1]MCQ9343310.1 methionine/alanine import NSS transporter subunit MetS [Corynebacterium sp. 76QC2CO]MCQ9351934.1 methionine/alanine import NSS transporter subunit MetS [Corynebacterium sp. 209RC1]MCQ9353683.1 methionine/alanine import NSS transporter subunit MetS [Corynebacterium sp. 1222RC1]MCQ9356333.